MRRLEYERYPFFDCDCRIGRPAKRHTKEPTTASELVAPMNHHSSELALVREVASVEGDPDIGNALLLDKIKNFQDWNLYALVRTHTNICVEISCQQNHCGVNEFVFIEP